MDLQSIQLELEDEMVSKGAERYAKELARGVTGVGPGKKLMNRALKPMAEAIDAYRANTSGRRKGMRYLGQINSFILADLTMRRLLDCAAKEETLTKTCKAIASAVEWHVKDEQLAQASAAIWRKTQERLRKTQNPTFRRKSIDGTVKGMKKWADSNAPELAEKLDSVKGMEWTIDEQIEVGTALIDLFAKSTGMVVTREVRHSRRKSKIVVRLQKAPRDSEGNIKINPETGKPYKCTETWLKEQNEYHAFLRPVHLPMVVPPSDWVDLDDGGYLDSSKARVAFIKTRANLEVERDLTDAFAAVNLIQKTPWRVNLAVFRVMNKVWNTGSAIGSLPPKFCDDAERPLQDLPQRLVHLSPEERKADPEYRSWAVRRRSAHEFNAELKSEVKEFGNLMSVATRFAQYPAFYHPHKLDWRQRVYPISVFLSPQGDQFNRGLIEFAEGKRMGDSDNSAAWLAIHGANTFGIDKVSFEDRIAWVEEHHNEIIEAAMFPYESKFWTEADKAWPFLAFCFEWLAYAVAGDDHITHLPISLDGSNSGLAHLSSMLLDPEGARVTCVMPGEKPEDVYQMIADSVEATLEVAHEDDEWADIWHDKVSRKICKQPTMTYTYSATETGMRDQIVSALKEADDKARSEGRASYLEYISPLQDNQQAATYLAPIVRQAIIDRVTKAAEAMDFLQKCSRVFSKTGLPLRWTTPLGVPVVQYYPMSTSKLKQVYVNGQRHRLQISIDSPSKLNKRRSTSGVSPNFVHSCDSSHALWTVLNCSDDYGIESFSIIHDSFATHATMTDELSYATREMFVALYDQDRLAHFRQEIVYRLIKIEMEELIDDLPPVPEFGTFDIQTVRESDYFFA